jgi:protein-arginine kinase activator protein McsA
MEIELIRERVRCCACGGRMTKSGHVNLVSLGRRATWAYPIVGNVVSGRTGEAVAIVCDACLEGKREIQFAIEFDGDEVVYHEAVDLEQMPPEKTYVLLEDRQGNQAIRCLRCGMTSSHPKDVEEKYCGVCHQFHEG